MKKYFAPNAEIVDLDTRDIMVVSGGDVLMEDITPKENEKGWIPDFGENGWI